MLQFGNSRVDGYSPFETFRELNARIGRRAALELLIQADDALLNQIQQLQPVSPLPAFGCAQRQRVQVLPPGAGEQTGARCSRWCNATACTLFFI